MIDIYSLVSGSSGNCSVVTNGKSAVMVDCGISGKRALAALMEVGISTQDIRAILITHEHTDHVKGAGIIARKLNIPVYATNGTHIAMNIGNIADEQIHTVTPDIEFEIGGIGITPYEIPHDAKEPCCYSFTDGTEKASIVTDIGYMPDSLLSRISGSKRIILESNHDVDMLRCGEYPYPLKQRILSDYGHLSNENAARTALELINRGTEHIMLGHLSEKNNLPEIAMMQTYNHLIDNGIKVGTDMTLQVSQRNAVTRFFQ